ncbi:TPA: YggU family protein [Legionella pneumophila]|nr:YggU family protein [Legionella pneumophila]
MWYTKEGNDLKISLYVQPGAKTTEIVGIHAGALKIRLNSPPIDGRANAALQKFLAKQFQVPLRHVQLIHGQTNRMKSFLIVGSEFDPESLYLMSK